MNCRDALEKSTADFVCIYIYTDVPFMARQGLTHKDQECIYCHKSAGTRLSCLSVSVRMTDSCTFAD